MKFSLMAAVLLLFAFLSFAGWNDMRFTSPQHGLEFRQGGNLTIVIKADNAGLLDGNAAYIMNITLKPSSCINRGQEITVPGGVVCPNSSTDTSCEFRFRNSTIKNTYTFENLPTDETCPNGDYSYSFLLTGNTEVGAGGSFASIRRSSEPEFSITFIGPHFCGDGTCDSWKGETCGTCPQDCGRCRECAPGAGACVNDSIATCGSDGFWSYSNCVGGCKLNANDEPECVPPCAVGEKQCISVAILSVCENHKLINITCPNGCVYNECKGNCAHNGCPESCVNATKYFNGTCSTVTGTCSYLKESCALGCNEPRTGCAGAPTPAPSPPPSGGGLDLTLIIAAAIVVLAVAALAYVKIIKK